MSSVIQLMIGMGIGLIALFVTHAAIDYVNPRAHQNRSNRRKATQEVFFAEPGKRCPICLETMNNPRDMQYLNCGHALHDDCCRQVKRHSNKCPECRADI